MFWMSQGRCGERETSINGCCYWFAEGFFEGQGRLVSEDSDCNGCNTPSFFLPGDSLVTPGPG